MTRPSAISLLGTGLLGRAMAERLQAVGYPVSVYNRTAAKARALQALGITVVGTPEFAIASSECIILVLTDATAIRSVICSPACTAALRGKTIIQMGTIGPDESLSIQETVERAGGAYCEAPVLGSLAEAKAGTLLVLFGGTEAQFARWNPVFQALSREPRFIGSVGKAATLKLALNHLIAAQISAFGLSLGLIQKAAISVDLFMAVLKDSALFAPTFEKKLPRLLARHYREPNFPTAHMAKDLDLIVHAAHRARLALAGAVGLQQVFRQALEQGLQHLDYSSVFDVINPPDAPRQN